MKSENIERDLGERGWGGHENRRKVLVRGREGATPTKKKLRWVNGSGFQDPKP